MYNSVTITRTIAAVSFSDARSLATSLLYGVPVDAGLLEPAGDPDFPEPEGDVAHILHEHQTSDRHARFPRWENPYLYGMFNAMCERADQKDEPLVFDVWQFDYGDVVHAHVAVHSVGTGNRAVPTNLVFFDGMLGTTTRDTTPSLGMAGKRPSYDESVAAYIFGEDNSFIKDMQYIMPKLSIAPLVSKCALGSAIDDPIWDTDPDPGDPAMPDTFRLDR